MLDSVLEAYLKAGQMASEVRKKAENLVKENVSLIQICEGVEKLIREKGGELAFPCNVCVNDVAAHYSSPLKDSNLVPAGSLVKVDIGVHVDGYIADTATTICLNPELKPMVQAVNDALEKAINEVMPGAKISNIGGIIQKSIESYGFKPIYNLSGHQMTRYILHTGKSIPNVRSLSFNKLGENEVFAIEPFLTLDSANGSVVSRKDEAYIHRFQKERHLKSTASRTLLNYIKKEHRSLPFSVRWLKNVLPEEELGEAFQELVAERCVLGYPVLAEATEQLVTQAEHTVIVTKDGGLVTTR